MSSIAEGYTVIKSQSEREAEAQPPEEVDPAQRLVTAATDELAESLYERCKRHESAENTLVIQTGKEGTPAIVVEVKGYASQEGVITAAQQEASTKSSNFEQEVFDRLSDIEAEIETGEHSQEDVVEQIANQIEQETNQEVTTEQGAVIETKVEEYFAMLNLSHPPHRFSRDAMVHRPVTDQVAEVRKYNTEQYMKHSNLNPKKFG